MGDGAQAGPPASAEMHDPLPESNWFWRRLFFYLVTAAIIIMVWSHLGRLSAVAILRPEIGIPAFVAVIKWLLSTLILVITYYAVAPSAEQIIRMIQVARSLREGVIFSGAAKVVTGQATAETSSSAGKPAESVPAPEPEIAIDPKPTPETPPWQR